MKKMALLALVCVLMFSSASAFAAAKTATKKSVVTTKQTVKSPIKDLILKPKKSIVPITDPSVILKAIQASDLKTVKRLIAEKAAMDTTLALDTAVEIGNVEIIQALIQAKAPLSANTVIRMISHFPSKQNTFLLKEMLKAKLLPYNNMYADAIRHIQSADLQEFFGLKAGGQPSAEQLTVSLLAQMDPTELLSEAIAKDDLSGVTNLLKAIETAGKSIVYSDPMIVAFSKGNMDSVGMVSMIERNQKIIDALVNARLPVSKNLISYLEREAELIELLLKQESSVTNSANSLGMEPMIPFTQADLDQKKSMILKLKQLHAENPSKVYPVSYLTRMIKNNHHDIVKRILMNDVILDDSVLNLVMNLIHQIDHDVFRQLILLNAPVSKMLYEKSVERLESLAEYANSDKKEGLDPFHYNQFESNHALYLKWKTVHDLYLKQQK